MYKFLKLSKDEKKSFGKAGREHVINNFDEKIVIDIYKNRWCNK